MRRLMLLAMVCFVTLFNGTAIAVPVVSTGTDATGTVNSEAAYLTWLSLTSSVVLDDLTGISGTSNSLSTTAGSLFGTTDDALSTGFTPSRRVLIGDYLLLTRVGDVATMTWSLGNPANAFSFFALDNDDEEVQVSIAFVDGTQMLYTAPSSATQQSSMFWGISGLGSLVSSVELSTRDAGSVTAFDRFSVGMTGSAPVPGPGSLVLLLTGLLSLLAIRKR